MDGGSVFDAAKDSVTRFFTRSKKSDVPPRLLKPVRFPFGEFEFQIQASPGEEVEISASRNLKHWEKLESVTVAKQSAAFSDKAAAEFPACFYRASSGGKSSNIVGFAVRELASGYSMIANPFSTDSNAISSLFSRVPDGTVVSKFSVSTFQLVKNEFSQGRWSNQTETLGPGEGALFLNPADGAIKIRFVGEVAASSLTISIHQGMSMRSSILPLSGRLDTDLGFPIAEGDVVSVYSSNEEKYIEHRFENGKWKNDPPFVRLCEAFWVAKNAPAVWTQQLRE